MCRLRVSRASLGSSLTADGTYGAIVISSGSRSRSRAASATSSKASSRVERGCCAGSSRRRAGRRRGDSPNRGRRDRSAPMPRSTGNPLPRAVPLVVDRLAGPRGKLADQFDGLVGAPDRSIERRSVEPLDRRGRARPETEREAAVRGFLKRGRGHREDGGRSGVDVQDRGTNPNLVGATGHLGRLHDAAGPQSSPTQTAS